MSLLPPEWPKRPETLEIHGDRRVDPWYWIRDHDDPDVLSTLAAENDYLAEVTRGWTMAPDALYREIRSRIKEDDESVPYRIRDFRYRTRFDEGSEYPVFLRRSIEPDAEEQVILDVNALAAGLSYCDVGALKVGDGQRYLAYAVDTVGRRRYEIRIRDLETGLDLPDRIPGTSGAMAWAGDDGFLFYVRQDPSTLRPFRLYRHRLGTPAKDDELVYEESDPAFHLTVFKTRSRELVMAASLQTVSTEFRALRTSDPTGAFQVVLPRERGHEYLVDHFEGHYYIRTNRDAPNFRLVRTPLDDPGPDAWEEVVAHRPEVLLQGFEIFRDHLVVVERTEALTRFRVMPWDGTDEHLVAFSEEAYTVFLEANPEFDTTLLRFGYTSLTTPHSTYDYDMDTRKRTLLKQREVLGDFDEDRYVTRRLWAPARDGARVPISLVYRIAEGGEGDFPRPLLLYGYGAYGIDSDPGFQASNLSLLDRGFVYAIAHVRGGEELGRPWYEAGRMEHKMNSFHDFIDAAEHLVADGWTVPGRMYALGGSAGGLLVGAVMNIRPDLFHGVVAAVPFVDVVTTMLDPSVPLTTGEYDEWGDPRDEASYRTMIAYSPYDNVARVDYPHVLITSGLHDSQVQFWEPTKWVAKLRESRTDGGLTLLRTNLDAGHGGASGRFEALRERALEYAFLIALEAERTGEAPQAP